jgi:pyridinium-3,5-bisthiocarboxylic acid mononucleotide nickel chelatase
MIRRARLPVQVVDWAIAVFRQLAIAEGAVHGIPPEEVHFHEVGAIDAIVDIVGTCLGLDFLGITEIHCSALPIGGGTVWAAHGRLPVPAPATLKLFELAQVPLYSNGIEKELVTPTGAAIVTALATGFGPLPPLRLERVGLGAGNHELPIPNILRLWIGKPEGTIAAAQPESQNQPASQNQTSSQTQNRVQTSQTDRESIVLLETQIDDMTPQAIGFVQGELLAQGALDVFTQPIAMKKNRPGVLLSVICHPEQAAIYEDWLLRNTTTLGVRRSVQDRAVMYRQIETVETDYGPVRVKLAWSESQRLKVHPEYEDCAAIARGQDLPLMEVQRAAIAAWAIAPWGAGRSGAKI